jgi:hypothetical protein
MRITGRMTTVAEMVSSSTMSSAVRRPADAGKSMIMPIPEPPALPGDALARPALAGIKNLARLTAC